MTAATQFRESDAWYRFVPRPLVTIYRVWDWTELGDPDSHWSALMRWDGEGEPVEPTGLLQVAKRRPTKVAV